MQPKAALFYTELLLDAGLWRVLREYASTDDAKSLTGVRARFLKKTLDAFRRQGAELDNAGKDKLKSIDVELAQITTKFGENVLDETNAFELVITDESRLAGLPSSAIEAARESAKTKGVEGWRFTLQAPSYTAVMTYMDDRGTREALYRAYMKRATVEPRDNGTLILRILELRKQKAELLGYKTFADLVLEDRMAQTGENALAFLQDLKDKSEQQFQRENVGLRSFAGTELEPWDISYFAEKERAKLYDFDEEALRPYFPLTQVVDGMFDLTQRLYGIRVVEQQGVPAWDPNVRYYEIHDLDGSVIGCFYADWYPRENKRGGAWMDAFLTGHPEPDGSFKPHLGLICGNLTPPVGEKPALLTHREVETVFHEFGHLLHHSLSRVEIRSLAGTNVAWDFVELPSQIMENWCWERPSLDLFARHYATGELIPEDLFQKLERARNFRAANTQMRQLGFGILDLRLHMTYDPKRDGDVLTYAREQMKSFTPASLPSDYAMIAGFTHIFSSPVGYAGGYYSYKWAEVLEADAFSRFADDGVFSEVVGMEFRERILAKGDSEDPAILFRSFMGRDPDARALLRRSGLIQ